MSAQYDFALLIVGVVATFVGGVVWAVRLEGRVNLLGDALSRHLDDSKESFRELIVKMDRLTDKLDKLVLNCVAQQHLRPKSYGAAPALHRRADDDDENAE